MKIQDFQKFIEKNIPLASAMQVDFQELSSSKVILKVPLRPNLNHKGTAFGGSQFAVCALACYGLVWALIDESKVPSDNIVIAESNIKYLKPVSGDFVVEVELPDTKSALEKWKTDHRLKLSLNAKIFHSDRMCTVMDGLFVIRPY